MTPLPIIHHPVFTANLAPDHRFPMDKFRRLMDVLIEDGITSPATAIEPLPATRAQLVLAHDPVYVDQVLAGQVDKDRTRRIGFPMDNPSIARRSCAAVGGTIETARQALQHGLACNTAGGSHHAAYDGGSGFCVFNDVAVAIRVLQQEGAIRTALVIDLDVHQGDGTAKIFDGDDRVFTFSMHCDKNFPHRKAASDLDLPLARGTGDSDYLNNLGSLLPGLLQESRPDIVFYNAGVDPHEEDELGWLSLTTQGLERRDQMVIETVTAASIPLAGVLGGGYMKDIDRLAKRHAILHHTARDVWDSR